MNLFYLEYGPQQYINMMVLFENLLEWLDTHGAKKVDKNVVTYLMLHHGKVNLQHVDNYATLVTSLLSNCDTQMITGKTITQIVTDSVFISKAVELHDKIDRLQEQVDNLSSLLEALHRSDTRIQACLIDWDTNKKTLKMLRAKRRKLLQKAGLSDKHDCNKVLKIVSRQLQSKQTLMSNLRKEYTVLEEMLRSSSATDRISNMIDDERDLLRQLEEDIEMEEKKKGSQKKNQKKLCKRRTDVVNNIARLKITLCVMKHATRGTIVQAITERWGKKSPELKLYLDLSLANPVMRTPVEQSGQQHQHSTTRRRMNGDDSETSVRNALVQDFPPSTYNILHNVYYRSTTQSGQLKKVELDLVVITKKDNILVQVIEVKTRFEHTNLIFKGIDQQNQFLEELRRNVATDTIGTIKLYHDLACTKSVTCTYSLEKPTVAHPMEAVQLRVVAPNMGQQITTIVPTHAPAVVQDVFNDILKLASADMDPYTESLEKNVCAYARDLYTGLEDSMESLPPVKVTEKLISLTVL